MASSSGNWGVSAGAAGLSSDTAGLLAASGCGIEAVSPAGRITGLAEACGLPAGVELSELCAGDDGSVADAVGLVAVWLAGGCWLQPARAVASMAAVQTSVTKRGGMAGVPSRDPWTEDSVCANL